MIMKHFLLKKHIWALMLLVFSITSIFAQPTAWTYVNTGANHTVLIQPGVATIDGNELSSGDFIGVFYNQSGTLVCAGYIEWTGGATAISAWGTESGLNNGFANNEAFNWKVWQASTGFIIDMAATYLPGFPNEGTYVTNGMSGLATLTGNAPVVSFTANGFSTDVSCYAACDGSISLTVSGGTLPYSFNWSNGAINEDLTDLCPGNYSVTVSDANYTSPTGGPFSWSYVNTGANHTVLIQTGIATIDGVSLASGDVIGVFYDEGGISKCAGYIDYLGTSTAISAWGAESGMDNGFQSNEAFSWKVWQAATGNVIDMTATYLPGFPNVGTYITNGMSGLATLTGTAPAAQGNSIILSFTISEPTQLLVSSVLSDYNGYNVSTNGSNDGSIGLTASGGTSPYTFSWSNGATTQQISNLPAGFYSATITDVRGCIFTQSFELTQPLLIPLVIEAVTNDNICNAACSGLIDLTISGGVYPYAFEWSNGATSEDLSNLCAGTYMVTVSDAGVGPVFQSQAFTYTISEPTAIISSAVVTNVLCYDGNSGGINLSVTGGTAPYSFAWSNGLMTEDLFDLIAGVYNVTISDANNCTHTNSFTVTQPEVLSLSAVVTDLYCNGTQSGSIVTSVSGGVTPYTYYMNNQVSTASVFNLSGGTYTIDVMDANGCFVQEIFTVAEPPALNLYLTVNHVSCNSLADGSVSAYVTGGTDSYTYMWGNQAGNVATQTGLIAGEYALTVTDVNGCFIADVAIVTEPAILEVSGTVSLYGDYNISINGASDGFIHLALTGGTTPYTYSWSNGSVSANLNNIMAGEYFVTITDANACFVTYSAILTQPDPAVVITASAVINHISCFGAANGAINQTVSGGIAPYTFAWSNNASTEDINNLTPGTYDVTIYDSNLDFVVTSYVINEPAALELLVTPSNYNGYGVSCFNSTTGFVNTSVTGGTMPYDYSWTNGSTIEMISNLPIGSYGVTVTDANGCMISGSTTLNQPFALASMSSVSNVSCFDGSNGSASFTVTAGGVAPYSYTWSNGATTSVNSGLQAGAYFVTATDANGCTVTTSRTITQPTALVTSIGSFTNPTCFGLANGTIPTMVTGGSTPYNYTWSDENSSHTANLNNVGAGTYSLTVTDSHGCTNVASQTLVNPLVLEMTSSQTDLVCNGLSTGIISVNLTGGTGAYSYAWSNGGNTASINNLAAGNYTVTASDANNCQVIEAFTLTQPEAITFTSVVDHVQCNGISNGAVSILLAGGISPYSIIWNTNETTTSINGLSGGTYTFDVLDANLCSFEGSVIVNEPSPIMVTESIENITCYNDNDGSIAISVLGGTAPYSYTWSNGAIGTSLSNLTGGDYTVTVLDNNSCAQTATFNVVNPAPVTAELVIDELACFGDVDASISVTPIGGTSPYYFAWSTGVFVQNLTGLSAGNYSLTITDINGCFGVVLADVTQPDQLLATHDATAYNDYGVSCYGASDGIIDLTVTGGVSPYTYLWSNGATTEDVSGLPAGEYSVGVIDGNGCSISEGPQMPWNYINTGVNHSILIPSVMVNGVPIQAGDFIGVFYNFNGVLACGGYIEWTGTQSAISAWGSEAEEDNGFQENEEFVWKLWRSADDVIIDLTPVYNSIAFPNLNLYTANGLSGLSDLSGSGPALQPNLGYFIVITQPEPLSASGLISNYNGYNVSCNGSNDGTIALDVVTCLTDYTIEWSNGATSNAISGLAAGDYSTTISYTVGEPIQSVPFSWNYINTGSNHTIFIPSASINGMPLEIGDYIGVFYDNNGTMTCGGYTMWTGTQTAITAWGTESGLNNGFADGESFNWKVYRVLDGQIVDMVPVYSPGFPNLGTYITNGISGLSSLTGEASISTFTGEVVLSFTLIEPTSLNLTAVVSNNACFGESVGSIVSTTTGGVSPYTYSWSNGATSSDLVNVVNGQYTVTVTDANGCQFTNSFNVTQPQALSSTAVITNISCNGGTDGMIVAAVSGGLSPYTYLWSNGGTEATLSNLMVGTYELQVIDANNCTHVNSFTVTEPNVLSLGSVITNVTCNGLSNASINIDVEGGTDPYTYTWSTGAVTANLTNIPAGVYSLTVVDAKGCLVSGSWTVTEPDALIVSEVVSNVTCFGGANGGIQLNVSGGSSPYSYSWSTNATTSSISGIPANAYYTTVVDANGCSVTKQIFVNQPTKITTDAVVTNITCFGANNGAVNLTVAGGVIPYSYMWSSGQTTEDITGLNPGQKSVIVTDANGCAASKSVIVAEPAALNVIAQVTNVSCNGGSNGGIDVSVHGGTAPYVYNWSNGATTQDLTGKSVGNFNLTVTDSKGCQQFGNYTITEPTALEIDYQVSAYGSYNVSANGANDGFIILDVTGGTFPYFYNWSNNEHTYYQIFITAGTYDVTITDLKGCSEVLSITLTTPPAYEPMDLTITPSSYSGFGVSCFGSTDGSATVNVANGTAPYSYSWSNGAHTASINALSAGSYSVTVSDATGATQSQSIILADPAEIVASGLANSPTCFDGNDGSIDLTITGGMSPYSYLWSNSSTSQNPTGLGAGNYTVTVTDSRNCHDVMLVQVSNPAQIDVQYQISNPLCIEDGSIIASASNGLAPYTYSWSTGAMGNTLVNIPGGSYTVTVNDANGCSVISSAIVSVGNPVTALPMIENVNCFGGNDGSISLVIDGGVSPYTLLWNNASTDQTILGLSAGTYTVIVTDDNACSVSYSYTITEPMALTSSAAVSNISCFDGEDGAIDLTVNGGVSPYSFSWNDAVLTPDRSDLLAGSYSVTITDANACTLVQNTLVSQPDQITLTASVQNLSCFKSNDGDIDLTVSGGTAPYTYYWSNGVVGQDLVNVKAGPYTVIVIDANNCVAQSGVYIITQPTALVATINLASPIGCSGSSNGSLSTIVSGGTEPYEYEWSTNAMTSVITGLGGGSYTLTVTDANGCQTTASYILIEPNSFSGNIYSTNVSCYGDNDGLAEAMALGGQYPFMYSWSNGSVTESITGLDAGTYTVTITDANNCQTVQITTITQPTQISVNFTTFAASAVPGSNAIVMANVTGGTGPYTYLWNNAVTTSYIKFVYVGNTVSLTVTDAHGCQVTLNYTITPGSVTNPSFESEFYAYLSQLSVEVKEMNIYPNPTVNGNFFVEFNGYDTQNMLIQLFDSYGRLVNDYTITNAGQSIIEVRMTTYSSGVYMVRFIDEFNQVITKRVVISE